MVNSINAKNVWLVNFIVAALLLTNIGNLEAQKKIYLDDRDEYFQKANAYFVEEKWEEGKKIVDEGLEKYPKDSDLNMLLGRYYYEKEMYDESRFELIEALKYNKNNSLAKQILVNVEIVTQRYSSAICYINELLELNPYWKEFWRKKIDVYRLQGNVVEANRLLKRISQIYPDDLDLRNAYLHYMEEELKEKISQEKIKEAIELTTTLVDEDPRNEDYYIQLVNNYLKVGDYDKALISVESGLYNIPSGLALINKKADILGELKRYDEVLTFLDLKMKANIHVNILRSRYNYFLEEAARHRRNSDAYVLYWKLYERDPRNEEAFNYIISQAVSRGLYEDVLEVIEKAKRYNGDTKELLLKERHIYERMGANSKADQILVTLYQRFPEDKDILYDYTAYRYRHAKDNMNEGLYDKAMNHWSFIAEFGDEEQKKLAMISIYTCCYQLGRYEQSLNALNRLVSDYPDETEWRLKRAEVYGKLKKYLVALKEYQNVIDMEYISEDKHIFDGYDELATGFVKELTEEYKLRDALEIIELWQTVNPSSETCMVFGVNISAQIKEYDNMAKYALQGLEHRPNDTFFQLKLAEAYNFQKKNDESLNILSIELARNPYHQGLINAYSQANEDHARQLIKNKNYQDALLALDDALLYDPDNKSLKYWKGVTYEKLGMIDSANYYQSFNVLSLKESRELNQHLIALTSKTFKNQLSTFYLRGRYNDLDVISTIATIEYTRFGKEDTYTGRINYSGKQPGKGIQAQAEWSHAWTESINTNITAAVSNKFFPNFIIHGSVFKSFKNEWEGELGIGYRNLYDTNDDMVNLIAGVAKELDLWWLNARFNSVLINGKFYYNIFGQARFSIISSRTHLSVMGSIGSSPDIEAIDNQLYDGLSVSNSMVGMGLRHLVTDNFTIGIIGNLYNYKDKNFNFLEGEGKNRNFQNILLQLHVRF